MKEKRVFLGVSDPQKIVLQPVFYRSTLMVVSPIEAPTKTCLHIEGPHQAFAVSFSVFGTACKTSAC